jgi:hypothetical protein
MRDRGGGARSTCSRSGRRGRHHPPRLAPGGASLLGLPSSRQVVLACLADASCEAAEDQEISDLRTQTLLHPLRGHSCREVAIESIREVTLLASPGRHGFSALAMSVENPSEWRASRPLLMRHLPYRRLRSKGNILS